MKSQKFFIFAQNQRNVLAGQGYLKSFDEFLGPVMLDFFCFSRSRNKEDMGMNNVGAFSVSPFGSENVIDIRLTYPHQNIVGPNH